MLILYSSNCYDRWWFVYIEVLLLTQLWTCGSTYGNTLSSEIGIHVSFILNLYSRFICLVYQQQFIDLSSSVSLYLYGGMLVANVPCNLDLNDTEITFDEGMCGMTSAKLKTGKLSNISSYIIIFYFLKQIYI